MAGHMGAAHVTVQNLKVSAIHKDKSLILIKGAIPGPKGGKVIIKAAVKK